MSTPVAHLRLVVFLSVALGSACAARRPTITTAREPAAAGDRIAVEVVGLRSARGVVRVALYASAAGFPQDRSQVVARCEGAIEGAVARCELPAVRGRGEYAIAILHDEDGDGEPMMNLLGAPIEGIGFSNDARVMLAPPSFEAARFVFRGGTMSVRITAQY